MKWIKASERLPKLETYLCIKYMIKGYSFYIGTEFFEDKKKGALFYDEDTEVLLKNCEDCYWLDETPEDWEALEKKFNKDFSTLTDKPMVGYDVIQWFKEKLDEK